MTNEEALKLVKGDKVICVLPAGELKNSAIYTVERIDGAGHIWNGQDEDRPEFNDEGHCNIYLQEDVGALRAYGWWCCRFELVGSRSAHGSIYIHKPMVFSRAEVIRMEDGIVKYRMLDELRGTKLVRDVPGPIYTTSMADFLKYYEPEHERLYAQPKSRRMLRISNE